MPRFLCQERSALDILADLNVPQRQAVQVVDGPLLVLAGAGSGKTRVITRRVAYLISQGVCPHSILALTFTNKAAGEMQQRVEALNCPSGATICTFHSLCARMLRQFAGKAQLSRNFSIYDRADQLKLVKNLMGEMDLKTSNMSPSSIHGDISRAKNDLQTADTYNAQGGDERQRVIGSIFQRYQQALADNNALDFDDLLLRMALLLRDRPEVRQSLSDRFRYILIDEYQDTNHTQYVIAHGIAVDHENMCVTGDPDQSIYAWRGADISNILEFEADYPNAVVVQLDQNYRSTQAILNAASRLIGFNQVRKKKALWTRRTGGPNVCVVYCNDEHFEAKVVCRRISDYISSGGSNNDVAVFYRVNSLSRVIEQAFIKASIPYRIARGVEFYNRKEVKDVVGYLRLMINPKDDLSFRRVINTPARGIGDTTVSRLAEWAAQRSENMLAACLHPQEAGIGKSLALKVKSFADMMASLADDTDRPVRQIVEDVIHRTGLEDSLQAGDQEAYANVAEIISAAQEFDNTAPDDANQLADYLQQISLVSDIDYMDGHGGAVTLMTLHAAKGLEFPAVFMIGCEDGLLPFRRAQNDLVPSSEDSGKQLEEERRLAFVGMTRAKDELTLTCARRRMTRGRTTPQAASPFIAQMGSDNVDVQDLTTPEISVARRRSAAAQRGFLADVEERRTIEAAEDHSFPPEYEYLRVGSTVAHPKFGLGKIVELAQRWPDTRATIDFRQWGRKKIVLSKTSVELVGRD